MMAALTAAAAAATALAKIYFASAEVGGADERTNGALACGNELGALGVGRLAPASGRRLRPKKESTAK